MRQARPMTHDELVRSGWGVRAQTRVSSTAYRSARQARDEGRLATVRKTPDGWFTVFTMAAT